MNQERDRRPARDLNGLYHDPDISGYRAAIDRTLLMGIQAMLRWVARHWLLVVNALAAIFAFLPALAPYLASVGQYTWSDPIYAFYRNYICHQLPSRSFVLWGQPMAYCERDTAIYTSILVAGLAFIFLRQRLRFLDWRLYFILIAPLAVDGILQLVGLYESSWEARVATGIPFGIANVAFIYPYFQLVMSRLDRSLRPAEPDAASPDSDGNGGTDLR